MLLTVQSSPAAPLPKLECYLSALGSTMRIWLACFGLLFAIAEIYEWVKHLTLPLPIYILGGAFLAIASNYNKRAGLFFRDEAAEPPSVTPTVNPPRLDNPAPQQPPKSIDPCFASAGLAPLAFPSAEMYPLMHPAHQKNCDFDSSQQSPSAARLDS